MNKGCVAMLCAGVFAALNLAAETNLAADLSAWKASAPKDVSAPTLTAIVDEDDVPGVRVSPTAAGPWQAMNATFGPNVKVTKDMKLVFKIRQNVRNADLTFYVELRQQGAPAISQNVTVEPKEWVTIELPFDEAAWKTEHNQPVKFGTLKKFNCFPYRALDAEGLYYEISDLKILDANGNALELTASAPAEKEDK